MLWRREPPARLFFGGPIEEDGHGISLQAERRAVRIVPDRGLPYDGFLPVGGGI